MGTSCLMIEKAPIVRQVGQIAKCAPLWGSQPISQMHQCREAASSMGRPRHPAEAAESVNSLHLRGGYGGKAKADIRKGFKEFFADVMVSDLDYAQSIFGHCRFVAAS